MLNLKACFFNGRTIFCRFKPVDQNKVRKRYIKKCTNLSTPGKAILKSMLEPGITLKKMTKIVQTILGNKYLNTFYPIVSWYPLASNKESKSEIFSGFTLIIHPSP